MKLTCFSAGCDTLSGTDLEFDFDVVYGISFLIIGAPNTKNGSFWFRRSSFFDELSCGNKTEHDNAIVHQMISIKFSLDNRGIFTT